MTHACEPTLFLLDDDPAVRQAMSTLSRSLQMSLEIFNSAGDFLDKFDPLQHGCLVLDVRLLGKSGLELLENLHRDGIFIATIVISADAEVPTAVRAMRAGAITFLEKPLDELQLREALQEALRRDAEYRRRQTQIDRIRRRREKLTEGEGEVLALLLAG